MEGCQQGGEREQGALSAKGGGSLGRTLPRFATYARGYCAVKGSPPREPSCLLSALPGMQWVCPPAPSRVPGEAGRGSFPTAAFRGRLPGKVCRLPSSSLRLSAA